MKFHSRNLMGLATGLGLLAACAAPYNQGGSWPPPSSGGWNPPVYGGADYGQMRNYCGDEAVRRYRVSARDVDVSSPRSTGNGYRVDGRVHTGRETRSFECSFGPRGGFDGMRETGVSGGGGPVYGDQLDVSRTEMVSYCKKEAARRYQANLRQIDMNRLQQTGGGFSVTGRVPVGGGKRATFECSFGPRGGFSSMREVARR